MATWDDALAALQPQYQGSAPRAAQPGTGAGPRAYAPGATASYRHPGPLAREAVGPAPPSSQGAPSPPAQDYGAPAGNGGQPQGDPMMAQMFARSIVDMLMRRARMRQTTMRQY